MRINLARSNKIGKRDPVLTKLLDDLARDFADEYAMEQKSGLLYLFSPENNTREIVVGCLREKGWDILNYSLPASASGEILSWGYILEDFGDKFLKWKEDNLPSEAGSEKPSEIIPENSKPKKSKDIEKSS
jgi:hypothetical protein